MQELSLIWDKPRNAKTPKPSEQEDESDISSSSITGGWDAPVGCMAFHLGATAAPFYHVV